MSSHHCLRPFGPLSWLLGKFSGIGPWSIIGALSAEDRCLTATQEIRKLFPGASAKLLSITPRFDTKTPTRPLSKFVIESERRRAFNLRRVEFEFREHVAIDDVGSFLQEDGELNKKLAVLAEQAASNVVLDISTMPKRYFFPLLTQLCESSQVRNLLVTNTSPVSYGEVLAGDADNWKPLPLYEGDPFNESPEVTLIVGVGYHPLNIQEIMEENKSIRVHMKLFFPFPSIHPGFIPNWKFVEHINKHRRPPGSNSDIDIVRVPVGDVSLTFDRLLQQTKGGQTNSLILAPYGPKPMSLAMCLLGIARRAKGFDPETDAPNLPTKIGYTQPSWYHPEYSREVRIVNGLPDVMAFCVRLNGRNLYALP